MAEIHPAIVAGFVRRLRHSRALDDPPSITGTNPPPNLAFICIRRIIIGFSGPFMTNFPIVAETTSTPRLFLTPESSFVWRNNVRPALWAPISCVVFPRCGVPSAVCRLASNQPPRPFAICATNDASFTLYEAKVNPVHIASPLTMMARAPINALPSLPYGCDCRRNHCRRHRWGLVIGRWKPARMAPFGFP